MNTRSFLTLGVAVWCAAAAIAASAPSAYIPPLTAKEAQAAQQPLPEQVVLHYLDKVALVHTYTDYEGQNEVLKASYDKQVPMVAAAGLPAQLPADELFGPGFQDGTHNAFAAAVASADAFAIRLCMNLSALAPDDELWLIDPSGPRAFGPYTGADGLPEGRWLPTVAGDAAVLVVRTRAPQPPKVALTGLSHFFVDLEKALACNIPVACATEPALQQVQSAVGMIVHPAAYGDSILCSGTLLNNSDTAAFEPYFLTAHHCGIGTRTDAAQVDVIWDYQAATCQGTGVPALASLPRSNGEDVLVNSGVYDLTLMELESVPGGIYGRMYAGWSTATLAVGDDVVSMHHPTGAPKSISYGEITQFGTRGGYQNEATVHWDAGVTEPGSSGGCLLLARLNYAYVGALTGGTTHSCTSNTNNIDWYSSFRSFFPQAESFLTGDAPPIVVPAECPAEVALKDAPQMLQQLRRLRDEGLLKTAWGAELVGAYYRIAPRLADVVRRSDEAREAFRLAATPFAALGKRL